MRRRAVRPPRRWAVLVQAVALVIAVLFGCAIFAAKVSAQPTPLPRGSAAAPAASAPPATTPAAATKPRATPAVPAAAKPPPPAAVAVVDAGIDAGAPAAAGAPAGEVDAGSPLDYAEVQTEADLPADLSDEEKAAIGTGKVPIHKEGKFRSPFAHPRFGGPATAKVGLVLNAIREFNIQTGSFEADFFLSLTADKPLGEVHLSFHNGKEVTEVVLADTPTFKLYRYTGTFISDVDLRLYPFDTQSLALEMEESKAGVDQLVFEPNIDRTSLDEGFLLAGWGVVSINAKSYKHLYPPRFDRDDLYVSRYKFSLGVGRFATSAAFSVFVPAYIIVLISLIGMWVPPDELEVRSNAGAPMLAAAVFFHYSLTQSLPATAYLTRADKLMLGVYIALLINMLSTWLFMLVDEEHVDLTFKLGRAWVPPLTVGLMLLATLA